MGENGRELTNRRGASRPCSPALRAAAMAFAPASAQEIHSTPGAPNATTTIDGHVLPPPPQKFGGTTELNAVQSKPYWPARVVPPGGAEHPFDHDRRRRIGAPSPGGVIPTPALDRIADNGLRHWQDRQADDCGHPADADGRRQEEADGGRARGAGRAVSAHENGAA